MDPNNQTPGTPAQPNQPFQAPPTPQAPADPYGFIMNSQPKQKQGLIPKDGSLKSRIMLLVGASTVLIIAIVLISSLFGGGKENNAQLLTNLAAEQTEIIRITDLGVKGTTSPDTLAFVQTVKSSVTTEQNKVLGYLALNNIKVTPVQLVAAKDKTIDTKLVAATASNEFDKVLTETLNSRLKTYTANLSENYKNASTPTSKKILSDSFKSTSLLLK